MRAYWIFVICLTVAYIIYYAVNIVRDLYGKKDENKSNEETFEVSTSDEDAEDASISVTESDTGFSIGDESYETTVAADDEDDNQQSEADKKKDADAAFERRKALAESEMEDIRPCLSDEYTQEELRMTLINKGISGNRPALVWKSSIDKL